MTSYFSPTGYQSPWPDSWEPALGPDDPSTPTLDCGPPPVAPSNPVLGPPAGPPLAGAGAIASWLDEQESQLTHPAVVEDRLRRAGWFPAPATFEAQRYRLRFNEHQLGYTALLVSTGIAALAAGTAGHELASGIDQAISPNTLGLWLTVFVVALPFAIWAHFWAAKVDREDPVAVWSQSRRSLARVLVWACGVVGVGRLVMYAGQLIGTLVGASWAAGASAGAGALNVAITISIALPLGLWAFKFLHRFDAEDPTQPGQRHRSARG